MYITSSVIHYRFFDYSDMLVLLSNLSLPMKVDDNAVNVSDHVVRINAELRNVNNSSSCLHLHKEGATLSLFENNFMKRS